jgi:hypothetical protein
MYNFKEFFTKNFDYTILMEARANRGTYIKNPTLLDEEDLDFLYQIDQTYWVEALQHRIQKTWSLLKTRQNIRNRISTEILNAIKEKFGGSQGSQKAYQRKSQGEKRNIALDQSNIDEFKNLILSFSEKYDNYGQESSSGSDRGELSAWLDKLLISYDLANPSTRGAKDNFRTIRDLIYEVIKHIIIYVKGGDQEEYYVGKCPDCKKIKFYINRYIEKLETLPGDEHTIKTKLDNLSQVYGRDMDFESNGKYGIDLSNARKVKSKGGKDVIYKAGSGVEGFNFSKISGAREALKNLYALNYHRHYGSLPSDDPSSDKDVTYRIVRSGIKDPKEIHDTEAQNTIQRNIFNFIKRFINSNKKLKSWNDPKISDLFENSLFPGKEKQEMESGLWLIRYILKNPNASEQDLSKIDEDSFVSIFHDNYEDVEKWKTNGKIDIGTLSWMTSWDNIAGNVKLKNIFAEYFSDKRTKEIIAQEAVHGPKILSVAITGDPARDEEIRKRELDKISEEDREKLKEILGKDWESFQKTGRIPYKIKGDELRIGATRTDKKGKVIEGDSPKIILPYVKIGEGEKTRSVPLLNAPSFIRSSEGMENKASVGLKRKIVNSLKKSGVNIKSIDLGSIEDLNDLLSRDEIDNDIKDLIKELIESIGEKDLESSLMTTSRSGVLLGKDGQETILNKFYKTPKYTHGSSGTRISGFRPEVSSQAPGSPRSKETRIGFAKIFPIDSPVMGSSGLLIDKNIWDYFKRNPELVPEKANPMKYLHYDLVDGSSGELGESFDLSRFLLIKEADDYFDDDIDGDDAVDRDTTGARKGGKVTSMYDKVRGSSYYEIKQVEDGYGNISGWSDIVDGMKDTFLNKKFGAGEANVIDVKKGIEEFQRLHDEIVDIFYINAKDEELYTSLGRKTRASSEIGKLLQREDKDLSTGSRARKSRTGTESMVVRTLKSSESPGDMKADASDLQPLAYDKSFDKQKRSQFTSIFFDTNNQIKFTSKSGRAWVPTITMPDSDGPEPYVFRKNKKDLKAKLYGTSTVLRYLSENSEQSGNYKIILEILDKEKNNLLSFWSDTFPKLANSYKVNMDKIGGYESDLTTYLDSSGVEIPRIIEDVYEAEKTEITGRKIVDQPKPTQQETTKESQIISGYNDMLAIVAEIEDILKDESYGGLTYFYKENKKDSMPAIGNWYYSILGLSKTLLKSTDVYKKESLSQVILKHMGGWSSSGQRLKYPIEAFLKKLSDNFNEFAKLLKIAPPNGVGNLATIRNQKDTIASQIPTVLTTIKSEFIKQAKTVNSNPEVK